MKLNLKTFACFLAFFLIGIHANAQQSNIKIFGTVSDSLHRSVADATVSLIKLNNQAGVVFVRTNEMGNFSFQMPPNFDKDSLALKINCIGFEKFIEHHFLINQKNTIELKSTHNALPDVVVKDSRSIVQKGDTVSYNADNFVGKSDRYLGDVIKNLPGISVDANGIIKYQGKPINNFYLGGDNLLGNNYNIATDNIPSEEIDKIQVIEHNQNVKMLNGIVPSDRAGINITFKKKNKLHFINNAELEGGTPGKWNGTLHNMSFSEKFKAINELKSNNEGISYTRETGVAGLGDAPIGNSLFNNAKC